MKKFTRLMILGVLILLITAGCSKQVFNGSVTGNDEQFLLDFSILNTTKTHDIKLEKEQNVDVVFEVESGKLEIFVEDTSGEKIYEGNTDTSGKFTLGIPKTDTYKISVTGKKAKGHISFEVNKQT